MEEDIVAGCAVCERIDWIKRGENPYFVRELNTGYVVMGDSQRIKGYTLFLCKQCAAELHLLEPEFRDEFLREMAVVCLLYTSAESVRTVSRWLVLIF